MNEVIQKHGYTITTDPDFLNEEYAMTPSLKSRIDELYERGVKGDKSVVKAFKRLIGDNPQNPQLKNYLTILYYNLGDFEKANEVNQQVLEEHPNYLFGKLNLTGEYLLEEDFEKVPEILGQTMELKDLYPQREIFHLGEITAFYLIAVQYFSMTGDLEQAEKRYQILKDIAPDHPDTFEASRAIHMIRMETGLERWEKEEESKIKVETQPAVTESQTTEPPVFHHPEVEVLYQQGLFISEETLDSLFKLQRETFIQDLETILQDTLVRYDYYMARMDEEGWDEETSTFAVHAVHLLGALESAQSLPQVLHVMSQPEEYLDSWFGDFLQETFWEPLYKMGSQQLAVCKAFMCKPGIYTTSKIAVVDMVEQIAFHQPERWQEVMQWFEDIFQFYLSCSIDDNIIDSELIAIMIWALTEINGAQLLPVIEELYDKDMVARGVCGSLHEIREDITKAPDNQCKRSFMALRERYEDIISSWAGYAEDDNPFLDYEPEPMPPLLKEPKIGRNDPCPCGSGKKYKKCCLDPNHA